jgi:uncharacterized protein (UPF0548 family)
VSFSYVEVGATREAASMPRDAHRFALRRELGAAGAFEQVAEFVLGFGMQRGAGLGVVSSAPYAADGVTVDLTLRLGPLRLDAPTRVVYVVDEPDRRGFAYGTLPGHPESGEELFLVERVGDRLVGEVRAFSRPGRWFSRLGAPVARVAQQRIAARYLAAAVRMR